MDKTSYKKYTIKAQIRKDRKLPKNVPNSILIVLVLLHCKRIGELDYIKAIAQVHSVSLAAERLGISQPALSAHLRKKEKELGVKLFDRRKQPLELTEAGKAYLEYAEKAASLEDEMHQRLSDIESLQTGHLTIGGASFFNNAYLPQAIVAFQKKYPGIELEIIDGKVPEIVNAAWKGMLDVFITPIKADEGHFHYEILLDEVIYLAVPSAWEINEALQEKALDGRVSDDALGAKALTKEEFAGLCAYPFICLKKGQDIGNKMEQIFKHFDCRPQQIITAEQTMTTFAMTLAGAGISLVNHSKIDDERRTDKVKLYIADETICKRALYVAYPKNKYLSKAAEEFIDTLEKSVE